jgi:hypothetical protein
LQKKPPQASAVVGAKSDVAPPRTSEAGEEVPTTKPLAGEIAVVAGAARGTGRGIATTRGEAAGDFTSTAAA